MDPHSRLSQFNKRRPSTGPANPQNKQMDVKSLSAATAFEQFKKQSGGAADSQGSTTTKKKAVTADIKSFSAYASRPIATNSRLRRDEKYKRDIFLAFIDNILSQKAKGKNENYNELVRQFSVQNIRTNTQEITPQLRSYLTALSHFVSKLDRSHMTLVDAIVHMPWTIMDGAFVKAYISFMGMLVSARPEYLTLVSEKTVQCLTYHAAKKSLSEAFAESSTSPITRRVVYDRVHSLIQQLLSLIPTLPSILFPILARHFPHKRQPQLELVTYIRNLLRVSDYCPELWDRLLGLVVDRTIQIDVEIQVEIEELETEADTDNEEIFALDIFDTVIGQESESSDSEDEDDLGDAEDGNFSDLSSDAGSVDDDELNEEQTTDTKHIQDMIKKLDCVLEVVFKHLDRKTVPPTRNSPVTTEIGPAPLTPLPALMSNTSFPLFQPSPVVLVPSSSPPPPSPTTVVPPVASTSDDVDIETRRTAQFGALLSIFERTILRTFKSRYTQFLLFWHSSLSNAFRDHFLGTVVSKALLETDQPVVTRAAAASYVASYVSRANFVDRTETRNVVRLFSNFIQSHLNTFDDHLALQERGKESPSQSAEQHAVFYAATQAIFLIFCFRWRDLLEQDPDDLGSEGLGVNLATMPSKVWLPELNVMQRAISSTLNPLKACSTNVVLQFALVAQKVGFLYCYPIIEANKRADYATPASEGLQSNPRRSGMNPAIVKQAFDADLSTFFPFDPYKLPRSSSYIEGIYRDWTAVAIDDDEEEDEDEDEEGGFVSFHENSRRRETEDSHMHGPSSFINSDADVLGTSFGGMSISPVHHMRHGPSASMVA